jgi:hypothetical protein
MRIEFLSSSLAALLLVGCQPATLDLKRTDTPLPLNCVGKIEGGSADLCW